MTGKTSTGELPWKRFRPHGDILFESGGILIRKLRARGPFNAELLRALKDVQGELEAEMRLGKLQRIDIVRFIESCLAPIDVIQIFERRLLEIVANGSAPRAVAYVLTDDVEGAKVMTPHFRSAHQRAGIPFCIFSNEADAEKWGVEINAELKKRRWNDP